MALERVVLSGCKFWEVEICARADWFGARAVLLLLFGTRAVIYALERDQMFVLYARAFYFPLERVVRI